MPILPEYHKRGWQRLVKQNLAYNAVNEALKSGELVRPTECSKCGKTYKVHGHHDDYDKPLDVMWLCPKCHKARHRELDQLKYKDDKITLENEEALRVYRELW